MNATLSQLNIDGDQDADGNIIITKTEESSAWTCTQIILNGVRLAAPKLDLTHARLGNLSPDLINLMIANNAALGLPTETINTAVGLASCTNLDGDQA